jgi:hypothetical protein
MRTLIIKPILSAIYRWYKLSILILALQFNGWGVAYAATSTTYYNIAHMINYIPLFDWAIANGANAFEADLRFDNNLEPVEFSHGIGCECTFYNPEVCAELRRTTSKRFGGRCFLQSNAITYFQTLATKPSIALFIIDSKISATVGKNKTNADRYQAGINVVKYLNRYLFANGYRGKVIIGVNKLEYKDYIAGAIAEAQNSAYKKRIYFSIDEETDVNKSVSFLTSIAPDKSVYGVGITGTLWFINFINEISAAATLEKANKINMAYIWSVDKDSTMMDYLNAGARGVMTNNPSILAKVYQTYLDGTKRRLALPSDDQL